MDSTANGKIGKRYSTQHIFITQTGINTAIELKSHLRKDKTRKDNNKNNLKSKKDNIIDKTLGFITLAGQP
jgi:hypothetical protein